MGRKKSKSKGVDTATAYIYRHVNPNIFRFKSQKFLYGSKRHSPNEQSAVNTGFSKKRHQWPL
jgi:hypothetical protein